MSMWTPETLHRTMKLELDEGRAATPEEAQALARSYVLQIAAGEDLASSPTRQAMLLTAINTGRRAFLGGVRVQCPDDIVLSVPWAEGESITHAAARFGAEVVDHLSAEHPTIVVGSDAAPEVLMAVHPTWQGWSAGVVDSHDFRLAESLEFGLSGVLAGALAVSECFQNVRGYPPAGRRRTGVSLWRPDLPWDQADAVGPVARFLPEQLWLLGLGHLGQAYGWALGFLPYPHEAKPLVFLQDVDTIAPGNDATSLLHLPADPLGRPKTRLVASRLEGIGFTTRIVERTFDVHSRRRNDEPGWAIAGFHDRVARRALEHSGFTRIVDGGLGSGTRDYLDMLVHTFPGELTPAEAFEEIPTQRIVPSVDQPAYRRLIEARIASGETEVEATCGVIELAGRAVGAAFVGATAASLVVGDILRAVHDGPAYHIIGLHLRNPDHIDVVANGAGGEPTHPGIVRIEPD